MVDPNEDPQNKPHPDEEPDTYELAETEEELDATAAPKSVYRPELEDHDLPEPTAESPPSTPTEAPPPPTTPAGEGAGEAEGDPRGALGEEAGKILNAEQPKFVDAEVARIRREEQRVRRAQEEALEDAARRKRKLIIALAVVSIVAIVAALWYSLV